MSQYDTVNEQLGVIDMCKCCEEINELLVLKDNDSFYKYEALIRRKRYIQGMCIGEVYGSFHKLNYCPMCGKRLGDD